MLSKNFILTVFKLYDELDALCETLDRVTQSAAVSLKGSTEELVYYIMDLNDKKRLLANLKVIHDEIERSVGRDAEIIYRHARGESAEDMSGEFGVCRSTVQRRLNAALKAAEKTLYRLGITDEKIETEYFSVPVIKSVCARIAARRSPKAIKVRGEERVFSCSRRAS